MKHQFFFHERIIEYVVRVNGQAKSLRISVRRNGEVVVTIPKRMAEKHAVTFVEEKREWIVKQLETVVRESHPVVSKEKQRANFLLKKAVAEQLVLERMTHFNAVYHSVCRKVTIKDHSTKWGSCSSRGNLNFNYRIVFLPLELVDYIVVHELCHLREMNHSPNFWRLVEKTIPDYQVRRRVLRRFEKELL
jgi:predicted metal-dependent hydrolase